MKNEQKGFTTIAIFLAIVAIAALFGGSAYYLSNKNSSTSQLSAESTSTNPASTNPYTNPLPQATLPVKPNPTAPIQNAGSLSVSVLLNDKDTYVGKEVNVKGKIEFRVLHYAMSCPEGQTNCDTTKSGGVYLWEADSTIGKGVNNNVSIYKNGEVYPCTKTAPEKFSCGSFTDGQTTSVSGVWTKEKVPNGWVGNSGGAPPTPISWTDIYYLNVK